MKKHFLFILLISAKAFVQGQAPDTWTDKNGLGMGIPAGSTMPARYGAVSFSINGKGYIGTGYNNVPKNDFWEFDPATNSLTQKANFGGVQDLKPVGSVLEPRVILEPEWVVDMKMIFGNIIRS